MRKTWRRQKTAQRRPAAQGTWHMADGQMKSYLNVQRGSAECCKKPRVARPRRWIRSAPASARIRGTNIHSVRESKRGRTERRTGCGCLMNEKHNQ